MADFPIARSNITTKISILTRPVIVTYRRDIEDHLMLDNNNAILMHDDELSVVTGIEMLNYVENNFEACDTITKCNVQITLL